MHAVVLSSYISLLLVKWLTICINYIYKNGMELIYAIFDIFQFHPSIIHTAELSRCFYTGYNQVMRTHTIEQKRTTSILFTQILLASPIDKGYYIKLPYHNQYLKYIFNNDQESTHSVFLSLLLSLSSLAQVSLDFPYVLPDSFGVLLTILQRLYITHYEFAAPILQDDFVLSK